MKTKYKEIRDYYLTYLECYYAAFITVFVGIFAIPILPINVIEIRLVSVFGFWFVGAYYLAQIIYTLGQIRVIFGYQEIDEVIAKDVKKLGFPFNLLEKVFGYARKPVYGRTNLKYITMGIGYVCLLGIVVIACFST